MDRNRRLRKANDFDRVFRRGRAWSHPFFALRTLPNSLDRSRFGFAVGKRLGNAVVRNRTKRRLREAARLVPVKPGWDIVLVARPPVLEASFEDICAALRRLLGRAGLLTEPSETHDQ